MWPAITLQTFFPEKWKLMFIKKKNLHTNVYSSYIHNSQELLITQVFFKGWMSKQTVIHSYHGIVSYKKEWTIDVHRKLDGSPENYDEWKIKAT